MHAAKDRIEQLLKQEGNTRINDLRQRFQDTMSDHCGVFRTNEIMAEGLEQIQGLKDEYNNVFLDDKSTHWNTELIEAMELQSILKVGEAIMTSAYHRKESRGAHSREDFPTRNDQDYLGHTLSFCSDEGVTIEYMPVVINRFEPKERKY